MADDKPSAAFVLCAPRSGSTLLRWLLDTHPEVACPAETYAAHAVEAVMPFVRATSGALLTDEMARRRHVIEETRRIVAQPLNAYARGRGKRVWVDKSPTITIQQIDRVFEIFPRARYFCLHRQCLDVVRSQLELSTYSYRFPGLAPYVARTPENVVEAAVRFWCDLTQAELAFEAARPAVSLRVRYEDVARDPKAAMPAIFGHLGLEPPPDLLERVFKQDHGEGAGDPKIFFTTKIEDASGRGAVVPHRMLTPATRARADELSKQLGYPRLGEPMPDAPPTVEMQRATEFLEKVLPARLARPELSFAGTTCKLVVGDGAARRAWFVDLRGETAKVDARDEDAQCTLELQPGVLLDLASRALNPIVATDDGRLRITGSRELAFKFYRVMFILTA
jgi:hypothetical protein